MELGDDLHLKGVLQVTAARDALCAAGLDDSTQRLLSSMLEFRSLFRGPNDAAPFEVTIPAVPERVGALVTSLELRLVDDTVGPEDRIAAEALLSVLRGNHTTE